MRVILAFLSVVFFLVGCSSQSIKPDPDAIRLSHKRPDGHCRDLGAVTGTTITENGTQNEAILDLKKEAANKGATDVMVNEFSAYGTTVTGQAFDCR